MGSDGYPTGATRRQWVNRFEIQNRDDLSLKYRVLRITGLPAGDAYDKNVNRLVTSLAYELRQPVALVRRGHAHAVVIPADGPLPKREQPLMPHVAVLEPEGDLGILDFRHLDATTAPIATSFLQFAFRSPLQRNAELWAAGRRYYRKTPLGGNGGGVDTYPGFVWNVSILGDGRPFLTVDTVVKYIDHEWLHCRINGGDAHGYLRRHCLYHFGHEWYMVQLWAITGVSIAQQQFTTPNGPIANVLSYTRQRWHDNTPPWVRDLSGDSPAIIYRYPGNEQERYGALALCKLALSTAEQEAAGLHRHSILDPGPRFDRIEALVAAYFQHAKLSGRPVRVTPKPLEIERRVFRVPALRFGQERVLAVRGNQSQNATDIVRLEQYSHNRQRLLLDPAAGPFDRSSFDVQYLIVPQQPGRASRTRGRKMSDFGDPGTGQATAEFGSRSWPPHRCTNDGRVLGPLATVE
jgi:hypothetical protein